MKANPFRNSPALRVAGVSPWLAVMGLNAAPLTWFPGPALNEARSGMAVAVAPGGNISLFGGYPTSSVHVLVYGGNNVQPLPSTRVAPGALAVNSGLFFIFGGRQSGSASSVTRSVLSYNPVSSGTDDPNVFTVTPMNSARYDMAYAADASGYGYAIGGLGNNNAVLALVERYDPVADVWTNVASLPEGRYHFAADFDGANTIYTFGGRTNATVGTETSTVLTYNVSGKAWSSMAPMPVATAGSAVIRGADGKIHVIGGTSGGVVTNLVQVYDPSLDNWTAATPLPAAVSSAGGAVDLLGRLVVFGGADGNNADLVTSWVSQQLNLPDAAPVISSHASLTANCFAPYTYNVIATGNPQPTFTLLASPAGMQIDPYSGLLTWTPDASQFGTNLVTIQANNYAGSTNQTFAINTLGPPLTAPVNVIVTETTANSATLSWDPVPYVIGPLTYRIYHKTFLHNPRGSGGTWIYGLVAGNLTSNTGTVGGLTAGKSYTFVVQANAAGATSGYSAGVGVTTLIPQPPTNLRLTALTSTSITLAWDASPGPVPIVSYEVWGWINNGVTVTHDITGISNTTLTINGLVPGSSHTWGVRGHDAAGNVSGFDYGTQAIVNPVPTPAVLTA